MIDIICYIPDLIAFRLEAKANADNGIKGFSFDDDGSLSYSVSKIPVSYNADGVRSVCLIRLIDAQEVNIFESLTSCERIGVCENGAYSFDEGGKDIYNDVYDQTPVELDDGTFYTPPPMIGVFA